MSEVIKSLLPTLARLTDAEKAELRELLAPDEDAPEPTDEEFDAVWGEEIDRRIADVEAGRVVMIPAEEVFRRLDTKLAAMRERRNAAS